MPLNRRSFLSCGTGAAALSAFGSASPYIWSRAGAIPWDSLRASMSGQLVLPSDVTYLLAKELYFSQFDSVFPRAVAYCASEQDVLACIRFAQDHNVPAVPRSGGHSHAGYSTGPSLVIDLSRMNSVTVGGATPTVTVGAGTQQVDALMTLAPSGLALVSGSCPTVGAAGFHQGGGYGLLTRSAGMACDRVLSARAVLACGQVVTCSPDEHADLFWAICGGGGGNFGIVTSFLTRPIGIVRLVNFTLAWNWANAAAVVGAWQDLVISGPRELGSDLAIVLTDAAPGQVPVVSVTGAWTGTPDTLATHLDAFVAAVGSAPLIRQVDPLSYRDAMMARYGCADKTFAQCHREGLIAEGMLARGDFLLVRNRFFDRRTSESTITALLAAFDTNRRAGHSRILSGASLGGQVNEVARTATAYVHRATQYQLIATDTMAVGTPSQEDRAAAQTWVDSMFQALDSSSNHESYQNMPDPALSDWRRSYYAENYAALTAVKQRYDPYRFFHFPQAVGYDPLIG